MAEIEVKLDGALLRALTERANAEGKTPEELARELVHRALDKLED